MVAVGPNAQIKGSTTIVEILRQYPNGEAARLMSRLYWPCAHCGGAFNEPLTMAAMRHALSPSAVLEAFRALDDPGGPNESLIERAGQKVTR